MTGAFDLLPSMSRVATPLAARRVAHILLVLFVLLAVGLAFVPWQQSVPGSGRVIALAPVERQQTIDAPVEGRVIQWHVVEGSRVAAGDLVVDISDNDPEIVERMRRERDAALDRLRAARSREQSLGERIAGLEGSRRNALSGAESRIQMAAERIRAAERALEAAEATLVTARLNIERQKQLNEKGLSATRSVELAQLEFDRAAAELDRAKASLNVARSDRAALEADREKTETDFRAMIEDARASRASAQSESANVQGSLQQIEMRIARQNTQAVRAARDGVILRLLAQPGSELLKSGEPLAILVPESSSTVVELWVSGNDMPLIHRGDKVRLQFEGWPAIQFVGWPSVAVGTFGGVVSLVDATDDGQGRFRILVSPDPNDQPWPSAAYLRQGVRANGWALLNVVPLGFELWRQFNGFPPAIAPGEPGGKLSVDDKSGKK